VPQPFLIVALPRSRTAWLARFLTHENVICRHEPSLRWHDPGDLAAFLKRGEGASDSMMTWLAHDARKLCPKLPLVVIRRSRRDVLASIAKLDYRPAGYLPWYLERIDRRLDRIEDELDPLTVNFEDLHRRDVCGQIFKLCLGRDLPNEWWDRWKDQNVQADVSATRRLLRENHQGVKSVYGPHHAAGP
jgi:hypothetical protein